MLIKTINTAMPTMAYKHPMRCMAVVSLSDGRSCDSGPNGS